MSSLDPEVLALVEMGPVEDLILAILRQAFIKTPVRAGISDHQTFPVITVRRADSFGEWDGDPRFLDSASILISTFAQGLQADEDAALLGEAVRVVLYKAQREQLVIPGKGHLTKVDMTHSPRNVPDWATATGPVQYADLPTGVERYEARYQISIRKPLTP